MVNFTYLCIQNTWLKIHTFTSCHHPAPKVKQVGAGKGGGGSRRAIRTLAAYGNLWQLHATSQSTACMVNYGIGGGLSFACHALGNCTVKDKQDTRRRLYRRRPSTIRGLPAIINDSCLQLRS